MQPLCSIGKRGDALVRKPRAEAEGVASTRF